MRSRSCGEALRPGRLLLEVLGLSTACGPPRRCVRIVRRATSPNPPIARDSSHTPQVLIFELRRIGADSALRSTSRIRAARTSRTSLEALLSHRQSPCSCDNLLQLLTSSLASSASALRFLPGAALLLKQRSSLFVGCLVECGVTANSSLSSCTLRPQPFRCFFPLQFLLLLGGEPLVLPGISHR